MLHVAAHDVIDERPGRGAAIVLTTDGAEDGLLEPPKVAALDLSTDLTALTACRTALDTREGGASAALSGSFLATGSPAVMATRWDLRDAATAAFMEQSYFLLARGLTPPKPCAGSSTDCARTPRGARSTCGRLTF